MSEPSNVWEWLDEKHWQYLPFWDGYQSPSGKFFISSHVLYRLPGEVIFFLQTGVPRTMSIFDTGTAVPDPKNMGFRAHKDGRLVSIRKVK